MEPEILVTISFRLPQVDREELAIHIAAVISEAIVAGGDTTRIRLDPYTPEEGQED